MFVREGNKAGGLTELFNIARPGFGVLLELLVQLGPLVPQKGLHGMPRLCVLAGRLERLQSSQILLAADLERRDGQLGQVVLVGIGDAALGLVVVVGLRHGVLACLGGRAAGGGGLRQLGELGH